MKDLHRVVDTTYGRHHRSPVIFPYLITKRSEYSPGIRHWAQTVMDRAGKRHAPKHRAPEVAA